MNNIFNRNSTSALKKEKKTATLQLKEQEKEQTKPIVSKRKNKDQMEINEIDIKMTI